MRTLILAALICVGSIASGQDAPLIGVTFEWPERQAAAIPDLRVADDVDGAREKAREATSRASEARRAAAHAKRRAAVQGAVGLRPQRATTDDDTEVALTRGNAGGAKLGSITYPTGATMTGAFGPDVGVYTAAPESPLRQFSGWIWGASGGRPQPRDGIFQWKNGDTFTGSLIGNGSASEGIYENADGSRRFVGLLDLSQSGFRPVRGYYEDGSKNLLAVIRR